MANIRDFRVDSFSKKSPKNFGGIFHTLKKLFSLIIFCLLCIFTFCEKGDTLITSRNIANFKQFSMLANGMKWSLFYCTKIDKVHVIKGLENLEAAEVVQKVE